MAEIQQFTHQGLSVAYRTFGHGPVPVLGFHGYGGSGLDFQPFAVPLAEHCTIHAIDIWFNGASRWPEGRPISDPIKPEELTDLARAFLDAKGIDRALYAGFSLGGRLAMSLMERLPERSRGMLLLAPDGLVRNPWYRWMSRFGWGRALYKSFQDKPETWFSTVDALHRVRLVTNKRHSFLRFHTENKVKRQLVHDVWLSLRLLEPDLDAVVKDLRAQDLHAYLYMGRFDSVIKLPWGQRFQKRAPERIHLTVLETGHQVRTAGLIATLVEHPTLWK
ncbi:MAG: alpha/beta hydrolase [Flavobacteriales bacterium]